MDDSSLMAPRMHLLVQKIEARRKFAGKSKSPASARRLRLKDRATGSSDKSHAPHDLTCDETRFPSKLQKRAACIRRPSTWPRSCWRCDFESIDLLPLARARQRAKVAGNKDAAGDKPANRPTSER
jgi:hypothetical protein